MRLSDIYRVNELSGERLRLQGLINAVERQGIISLQIEAKYLDKEMIDLIREPVLVELRRRKDEVETQISSLGVEPHA